MPDLIHDPEVCLLGKREPGLVKHWFEDIIDVERVLATELHISRTAANGPGWSLADGTDTTFSMYLNDTLGDCTCATVGNLTRAQSHGATDITNADVQAAYVAVTTQEGNPYDPATGANADAGCVETDVLDYWASAGVGAAGKISAHAGVKLTPANLQAASQVFGGIFAGWQLATQQQSQQVWDYVQGSQPGSWGGHATPIVGFNTTFNEQTGLWEVVTWGAVKYATDLFVQNQLDEAHIIISPAWVAANADNPAVSQSALQSAIADYVSES